MSLETYKLLLGALFVCSALLWGAVLTKDNGALPRCAILADCEVKHGK